MWGRGHRHDQTRCKMQLGKVLELMDIADGCGSCLEWPDGCPTVIAQNRYDIALRLAWRYKFGFDSQAQAYAWRSQPPPPG